MVKIDLDKDAFLEIVKRHVSKNGRVNWEETTIECNAKSNEILSSDAWRSRYRRLVDSRKRTNVDCVIDYAATKKRLIEELKRPLSVAALERVLKISKYEVLGLIKEVNDEGLYQIIDVANGYQISKNVAQPKRVYQHSFGDVVKKKIMVISDSHMGSIYQMIDYLNFLYDYAQKEGITDVYHIGDIVDGHYINRPEQLYALSSIGFDAQLKNVIDNYPYRPGITTYFILGNHDETHIRNGGANIGTAIGRIRQDMKYLGIGTARIMLTKNCSMDMLHPLDGSSYALSYSGQKYMDALTGGDKPNILVVGHHHKAMYMFYRNIHYYEVPSTCMQSNWEKRNRLNNTAGAWILNIEVDELGTISSITNELLPHYAKKSV